MQWWKIHHRGHCHQGRQIFALPSAKPWVLSAMRPSVTSLASGMPRLCTCRISARPRRSGLGMAISLGLADAQARPWADDQGPIRTRIQRLEAGALMIRQWDVEPIALLHRQTIESRLTALETTCIDTV
jgi:hypothetical protein